MVQYLYTEGDVISFQVRGSKIGLTTLTRSATAEIKGRGARVERADARSTNEADVYDLEITIAAGSTIDWDTEGPVIAEVMSLFEPIVHAAEKKAGLAMIQRLRKICKSDVTPALARAWLDSWGRSLRIDKAANHRVMAKEKRLLGFVAERLGALDAAFPALPYMRLFDPAYPRPEHRTA